MAAAAEKHANRTATLSFKGLCKRYSPFRDRLTHTTAASRLDSAELLKTIATQSVGGSGWPMVETAQSQTSAQTHLPPHGTSPSARKRLQNQKYGLSQCIRARESFYAIRRGTHFQLASDRPKLCLIRGLNRRARSVRRGPRSRQSLSQTDAFCRIGKDVTSVLLVTAAKTAVCFHWFHEKQLLITNRWVK